jgi:hypothetical protein
MMHRLGIGLAAVLALGASGCHGAHGGGNRALAQAAVTGLEVATVAAAAAMSRSSSSEESTPDPLPDPTPDPDPPALRRPPFDLVATRAALRDVDLSQCKPASGVAVLAHANVTLEPSGDVVKVDVDDPIGLDPKLRSCVAKKLADAAAPAFGDDGEVTIGFSFTLR